MSLLSKVFTSELGDTPCAEARLEKIVKYLGVEMGFAAQSASLSQKNLPRFGC